MRRESKMEDSTINSTKESSPLLGTNDRAQYVAEVEVHLFLCGEGPIDIFRSRLGGRDQNELEIHQILEKYGLKMVYGFNIITGRGVTIKLNPRTGRSVIPYNDGTVLYMDGEPKDSTIRPVWRIILWITFICVMLVLCTKETPEWAKKMHLSFQTIPPWMLTCAVIIFTRLRKRKMTFFNTVHL